MSRVAAGPDPRRLFQLDARIGEVLATVALLPAGVAGAFQERIYDLLSHHRKSVLQHNRLPGGRAAQRWLATRLYRFTRNQAVPGKVAELVGEGFAAAVSGETFGPAALKQLEHGGTISSREQMAIPSGHGRGQFGGSGGGRTHAAFAGLLAGRKFDVTPRGGLVTTGGRQKGAGLRSIFWGVLRRSRRQPPQLGYYARFADVQSRHVGKFEADLERAATAAGREALAERTRDQGLRRGVYIGTLRKYLEQHPGKHAEARRVAAGAARAARQAGITGPGRA